MMGQPYTAKNWQPIPKPANAATPPGISVWKLKEYVPPKDEPVRPGAQDAFKILSRGV